MAFKLILTVEGFISPTPDSRNIVEVSLESSKRALKLFRVASLQDITGFHIMAYNF